MTLPAPPTLAYDLTLLQTPPQRGTERDHGWCYGLPPGIRPEQWPLSPHDGFPMQHCFTLRLPAQYRARGEAYVALAMFADQQYDEPVEVDAVARYLAAETIERPADGNLLPYWTYAQHRHPTECRMKDIIDHNFVAIWLTEAEFAGPLCAPPELAGNPLLQVNPPPRWIEKGAARTVFEAQVGRITRAEELKQKYWYRLFGHVPEIGHHAYGIALALREGDPNVGKPPRDHLLHKAELGGYVAPYSLDGKARGLERLHRRNHLGGTMFPNQWTPKYSPTYLEIEEHFGGFNFGGGNGQLDLADMEFDWACG
ncbi:hypothetical protein CI1B_76680 [Bradyrhizobium ivorense]|uniref:Uncharacterized protein n=1 Tax=Bradyrhizobium ivorense TaxID=2511166 RepID=A0A508TXD8_9BRAD|nr:hypothetical protein [Bradyrhizobium ivorense]VIO79039.1 hypothetical protein CI1B_76680 [Bradyrhizobium ivorense]